MKIWNTNNQIACRPCSTTFDFPIQCALHMCRGSETGRLAGFKMHKTPSKHLNHINILHLKLSKVLALIVKVVNVSCNAGVVKLVYTMDSKSIASNGVAVQVRPPVPFYYYRLRILNNPDNCTIVIPNNMCQHTTPNSGAVNLPILFSSCHRRFKFCKYTPTTFVLKGS